MKKINEEGELEITRTIPPCIYCDTGCECSVHWEKRVFCDMSMMDCCPHAEEDEKNED